MALDEAVLEIAEQMLAEAKDLETDAATAYTRSTLKGYARQLKSIVKAAEGTEKEQTHALPNPFAMDAGFQHFTMVEQAKEALRLEKKKSQAEEKIGVNAAGNLVLCEGGKSDGIMTPIEPEMPVGARTMLDGEVYEFKDDGKFHFDEEITKKVYKDGGKEYIPEPKKSNIILA